MCCYLFSNTAGNPYYSLHLLASQTKGTHSSDRLLMCPHPKASHTPTQTHTKRAGVECVQRVGSAHLVSLPDSESHGPVHHDSVVRAGRVCGVHLFARQHRADSGVSGRWVCRRDVSLQHSDSELQYLNAQQPPLCTQSVPTIHTRPLLKTTGSWAWRAAWLYGSLCNAIFLVRTMKQIIFQDAKSYGTNLALTNYLLLALASFQFPLLLWLTNVQLPSSSALEPSS